MIGTIKKEYLIYLPGGYLYAKKWIPEGLTSEIPVVLLHDSLGSVGLWGDFPEVLASRLSQGVIAYDRLGYGKSDARAELPSIGFIEEEAIKYFPLLKEALSLTKYILLGHSVGGAMAINIAARDAGCAAVITVSSQAFVEGLTIAGIEEAKHAFMQPGQMKRLGKWHGKKAEWVLSAWTDVWLSDEFSSWSLENSISQVVCPLLAIHGDQDEYGSKAFPEFIAGKAGGPSEMLILQDCGHLPHKEQQAAVIEAVYEFLKSP